MNRRGLREGVRKVVSYMTLVRKFARLLADFSAPATSSSVRTARGTTT